MPSVTFTITGEFITEHARSLYLEGKWVQALSLLVQNIEGMTDDLARKILQGEGRLVGDSEMALAGDDDAEHKEEARWTYAGRAYDRASDRWLRPYAWGTQFQSADHSWAESYAYNKGEVYERRTRPEAYSGDSALGRSVSFRHTFYRRSDRDVSLELTDLDVEGLPKDACVLFEECGPPPHWVPSVQTAKAAVEDAVRGGRVLDRLDAKTMPVDPPLIPKPAYDLEARTGFRPTSPLVQDMREVDAYIARAMKEDDDADVVPDPDPEFHHESGYIDRKGTYWGCPYHGHAALADRLARLVYDADPDDPQKWADNEGWVRIQVSKLTTGTSFMCLKRPTRLQERTLVDYCNKYDKPYPEHLNERF